MQITSVIHKSVLCSTYSCYLRIHMNVFKRCIYILKDTSKSQIQTSLNDFVPPFFIMMFLLTFVITKKIYTQNNKKSHPSLSVSSMIYCQKVERNVSYTLFQKVPFRPKTRLYKISYSMELKPNRAKKLGCLLKNGFRCALDMWSSF